MTTSRFFCKSAIPNHIRMFHSVTEGRRGLKRLKQLHALLLVSGLAQNSHTVAKLVNMYSSWGSIHSARLLFDRTHSNNVYSWNVIIRSSLESGLYAETLELYHYMQKSGSQADRFTYPYVLKACASLKNLKEGKKIHHNISRDGLDRDAYVGAALINMYAKCSSMEDALQVFNKLPERNVVLWTSMIAGYAQNGQPGEALRFFSEMLIRDVKPNSITMISVLPACAELGDLKQGKVIHNYVIRRGLDSDVVVGNALVGMYANCGWMDVAHKLFDEMSYRDVVSWNAIIAGYVQIGQSAEALKLFNQMRLGHMKADSFTLASVLQACAHLEALQQGKWMHGYVVKSGFEGDGFVGTVLIDMYIKCGILKEARHIFDKLRRKDMVCWSLMIVSYDYSGHAEEALKLFHQMRLENVKPNAVTMASVISVCSHLGNLKQGELIHVHVIKSGFESDICVRNSLIAMYAKCGNTKFASQLFDSMCKRNVVSWNAMISGYSQNGYAGEVFALFNQMHLAGVNPNAVTLVTVPAACSILGASQPGKLIHGYIIKSGWESDVSVITAMIDMYSKCGSIYVAHKLFDEMPEKDVVSWSAMIAAYGMHGQGKGAIELFSQMLQTGTKPNNVTFVSILSACSHAGLVDEGWQIFESMSRDFVISPSVKHYACMVDILGRAGHLDEAQNFIKRMPLDPNADVWKPLLGACRVYCNLVIAKDVAEHLFHLDPYNSGNYVLLSNIYAAAGRWDDAANVRKMMKDRGLKKTPACSFIELDNKIHKFLVGDKSHPQSAKIYSTLESLTLQMVKAGYVSDTNFVLHDVEDEVKENMLSSHSEKLAIAFGLINTKPGTPILITKNLRVCGDCHNASKFISRIVNREIIMRDSNRFHHFKDGLCSCGDYW
ncbi:hypothetical protein SUGI_0848630 [Cryptomeria japonica]|uniref:pentatricopeptide repeat-containing protein At3g26782, mitochondrial n=1 Tax=Cryptomeria japonica TaxID=3369 RepID=UPI002414A528|nr:pentatricopeptide repeat-containing protein At3g26782, mitochondrial [Cryptomeria japonica]GLJ40991.1 hypothetical protein SUGI_0848630 [Cryptomeria japonica]